MIAVIAAIAENGVIGKNGKIPWKIPGEQRRFKQLTMGNIIIMGRNTFQEIIETTGNPLPGRITLLLSKTVKIEKKDCHTFDSLERALAWAEREEPEKDVYIAGGAKVYQVALPYADRLYLTKIEKTWEGDVYFPQIHKTDYRLVKQESHKGEVSYCYLLYEKIKNEKTNFVENRKKV